MKINELIDIAHGYAKKQGFWDKPREIGTTIALIHSELSEALEADRNGDKDNFAEELGDAVIRICDLCGWEKIDLEIVIADKIDKNYNRPKMHGKKY